jgi:transposase
VRVPTEGDEHRRHLHRELRALITDRRRVTNRIGGLLATQGIRMKVRMDFRKQLPRLRQWNGDVLAETFQSRLEREWQKVELYSTQILALERERTHSYDSRPIQRWPSCAGFSNCAA